MSTHTKSSRHWLTGLAAALIALSSVACVMGPDEFTGEEEALQQKGAGEQAPKSVGGVDEPRADEAAPEQASEVSDDDPAATPPTCATTGPTANTLCANGEGPDDNPVGHGSPQPLVPTPPADDSAAEARED